MCVDDDVEAARDAMRPVLALYVGGMGSRKQNFYNALVRRYGFEDAAREVQDLYLDGKKDEAAAALPDELIDTGLAVRAARTHVARAARPLPRAGRRHADDHADGVRPAEERHRADARARGAASERAAIGGASSSPRSATRATRSRCSRWGASSPRAGTR